MKKQLDAVYAKYGNFKIMFDDDAEPGSECTLEYEEHDDEHFIKIGLMEEVL